MWYTARFPRILDGTLWLQELPVYDSLADPADAAALLSATAVLKLNGGLGTSMGLEKAKSLLPVKDGKTFLDLIAEQARLPSYKSGCNLLVYGILVSWAQRIVPVHCASVSCYVLSSSNLRRAWIPATTPHIPDPPH